MLWKAHLDGVPLSHFHSEERNPEFMNPHYILKHNSEMTWHQSRFIVCPLQYGLHVLYTHTILHCEFHPSTDEKEENQIFNLFILQDHK